MGWWGLKKVMWGGMKQGDVVQLGLKQGGVVGIETGWCGGD